MGAEAAGAAAPAPGMPNLPASMDNFDAIVNSYDNIPEPAPPSAAKPGKPADLATIDESDVEGDEGFEAEGAEGEEGDELEQAVVEPELAELAERAKDWAERPDLPEEFMQKKILAEIDGEQREITVEEAKNAYQRRAVTTRSQQEAASVKQYYEGLIHGTRQQHQRWNADPNQLEADLVDMNLEPHLEHIVQKRFRAFAEEQAILDSITDPARRQVVAERFKQQKLDAQQHRQDQRARLRAEQQAQQNSGQTQHEQLVQRTSNQMAQLAPRALRAAGFPKDSPYIRNLLGKEVRAIHKWGTDLTPALLAEAAKNAKDIYDQDHERALAADAAKRVRSKALPPQRRASGNPGGQAAKPPASKQQVRVSDIDRVLKEHDGRR